MKSIRDNKQQGKFDAKKEILANKLLKSPVMIKSMISDIQTRSAAKRAAALQRNVDAQKESIEESKDTGKTTTKTKKVMQKTKGDDGMVH